MRCTASSTTMPTLTSVRYSRRPPCSRLPRQIWNVALGMLPVLLDDPLQLIGHRRNRHARDPHTTIRTFAYHDIDPPELRVLVGKVLAEVSAPTLLALDGRARDGLGHHQEIVQVDRRVPARVVLPVS